MLLEAAKLHFYLKKLKFYKKFSNILNQKNIQNTEFFLENYKDVSDMVKSEGYVKTLNYLNKIGIK